jgi:hypothetical protein
MSDDILLAPLYRTNSIRNKLSQKWDKQQDRVMTDLRNKSLLIWKQMPEELLFDQILHRYCDGTSLSDLMASLLCYGTSKYFESYSCMKKLSLLKNCYISPKDPFIGRVLSSIIDIGRRRMEIVIDKLEYSSQRNMNYSSDAILWLKTALSRMLIQTKKCVLADDKIWESCTDDIGNKPVTNLTATTLVIKENENVLFVHYLHNFFLLLDLMEGSIRDYSSRFYSLKSSSVKEIVTCYEWPIWCGVIVVDTLVDTLQVPRSATIVITAPITSRLNPISSMIHGWQSILSYQFFADCTSSHRKPTESFRCEPLNMIPVPPWGRIRGLTIEDEYVLQNHIGMYLHSTNQVAIPQQCNPKLNICILPQTLAYTKRGGLKGLQRSLTSLPVATEWILHEEIKKAPQTFLSDESTALNTNEASNESSIANETFPLICTWQIEVDPSRTSNAFIDEKDSIDYLLQIQNMIQDWTSIKN